MTKDLINPEHYKIGNLETIDIIRAKLGPHFKYYIQGSILKYATRLGHKDDWITEAKKISWYAEELVEECLAQEFEAPKKKTKHKKDSKDQTSFQQLVQYQATDGCSCGGTRRCK